MKEEEEGEMEEEEETSILNITRRRSRLGILPVS